ncbi:Smr/MutS family protein, partial [Sphaerochaeta sp.]
GYGDGILSKGISSYLEKHHSIRGFRFANPEDGGMGKTYVEL